MVSMASEKMSDPLMDKIDIHLEAPVFRLKNSATYALANRTKKVGERVEALCVVPRERLAYSYSNGAGCGSPILSR